ncbi:MAG: hypothetical protein N2448_11510 [Caloramator sp.]|nr:hypothetical protein [Caloramator sp.]
MLSYHSNCDKDKISMFINDCSKGNRTIASIIAGFYRTYGFRNEGTALSLEIVNSIKDDTLNLKERNLLVWNLYLLSSESIDDEFYDEAQRMLDRAEKNWSRDVILGDDIGVYHVSWIEQIWLKKAEIYLLIGDKENFEIMTDRILCSRFELFKNAYRETGESIIYDRCTYSCLELMAIEMRKRNVALANKIIKKAVLYKGGFDIYDLHNFKEAQKIENNGMAYKAFQMYLKEYYKLLDSQYDNLKYGYCSTCFYFDGFRCNRYNLYVNQNKSCSYYRLIKSI